MRSRTSKNKLSGLKLKWWYILPVVLLVAVVGYSIVRFSKASSFSAHVCFVKKVDSTLWCWGINNEGQLGIGNKTNQSRPVKVPISNVRQVQTGADHTCAIKNDGTLWCWGNNRYGQLGIGNYTTQLYPKQLYFANAKLLSLGTSHSCASREDGTLWCWGGNNLGQLGIGNNTDQTAPKQLFFANTTSLGLGADHTCASRSEGTLWCWGGNDHGQLGIGNRTNQNAPRQLYFSNTVGVRAGTEDTCANRTDGTFWCWGANNYAKLGFVGSTGSGFDDVLAPYKVTDVSTTSTNPMNLYSLGDTHTCASKADGTLWCWGYNGNNGQLGLGIPLSTRTFLLPIQLNFKNTALIKAGFDFTCASKTDGTVWCWGNNLQGQLGLGTIDNNVHDKPVQVPGLNVN